MASATPGRPKQTGTRMSASTTKPIFTPEIRFQQYKLMVDIVIDASDRRDRLQAYYLTYHTVALAALAASLGVLISSGATHPAAKGSALAFHPITPFIVTVIVVGVLLSLIWRVQLNAQRRLAAARYQMLFNMELDLPYQIFLQEWERLGKGRHMTDTALQRVAPLLVVLLYLVLAGAYLLAQPLVR
jgi:hypothetical protein